MTRRSLLIEVIVTAVIVVAGFGVLVPLSNAVSARKPTLPETYKDSDLTLQGGRLRGFAFGAESLAADWYWMRSLQYIGGKLVEREDENIDLNDLSSLNPRLLYPLLDTATDLDPHFMAPYSYGAIVLPAIDANDAIKIIEKGIANNPREWRLYQHLGYIYWKMKRYEDAAKAYQAGAKIDGAPVFMELMAAAVKTQGGSRETARAIYEQTLSETTDDGIKQTVERRLLGLRSQDERDAINAALADALANTGRCPATLNEIIPRLASVKVPSGDFSIDRSGRLADPTGVAYLLDRNSCKAQVDRTKSSLPSDE